MADVAGPGWHRDPTGRHEYRYWDGVRWTDDVSDQGLTTTETVTAAGSAPLTPPSPGVVPGGEASVTMAPRPRAGLSKLAVLVLSLLLLAPAALFAGLMLDNLGLVLVSVAASLLVVVVPLVSTVLALRRRAAESR